VLQERPDTVSLNVPVFQVPLSAYVEPYEAVLPYTTPRDEAVTPLRAVILPPTLIDVADMAEAETVETAGGRGTVRKEVVAVVVPFELTSYART
jgi:hypothetical protein